MLNILSSMFESRLGHAVYSNILDTMQKHSMSEKINKGVLIGLSGGADSVLLACFIKHYQLVNQLDFTVACAHLNHMIRGTEAFRDEEQSRELSNILGFEYISRSVNVPELSRISGKGIEEAAREARYSYFREIIEGREDLRAILTAHNSTDNVETVLFNLARGCALSGASGISPVRGEILRPLINVSKSDVLALLDAFNISYMHDSTNDCVDYTRNYIRHNILPSFLRINTEYERHINAFSDSARYDSDFLDNYSSAVYESFDKEKILLEDLRSLHPAVLSRVLILMAADNFVLRLDRFHIDSLISLIKERDNFKLSLPNDCLFVAERGSCFFVKESQTNDIELEQELVLGLNKLNGFNAYIELSQDLNSSSSIVYKTSIQAPLSSVIINGSLKVRFKRDGDKYFYGGMTHKLKKVFNDRNIPPHLRGRIPVVYDDSGIVWVPGLPPRDDGAKEGNILHIRFIIPEENNMEEILYYVPRA